MASAARRVLSFKSAQASCRRNIHCAEIHSRGRGTIAAPGPPLSGEERRESAEESEKRGGPIWRRALSSSSQRTPGPRDHRALDGNQKGIEPPWPPQHRRCRLFTSTQASCRRNIHCAEIHSRGSGTTAAPGHTLSRRKRSESAEDADNRGGPNLPKRCPSVFPANAGTQGPPSSGRQPRGHRTTTASA